MEAIGCPLRLSEVGIQKADLPGLARQVNIERLSNNPRKITDTAWPFLLEATF